jgi:hypothetical protein
MGGLDFHKRRARGSKELVGRANHQGYDARLQSL